MSQSSDIIGSNETFFAFPDAQGHFGRFGGQFVSETLMAALDELRETYEQLKADPAFTAELASDLEHYVGRASPLYHAERLSERYGGAQIWLKREDLNHTGAHKVNNCIGHALLARFMGCLLYTSPSPRDVEESRMPSSA